MGMRRVWEGGGGGGGGVGWGRGIGTSNYLLSARGNSLQWAPVIVKTVFHKANICVLCSISH